MNISKFNKPFSGGDRLYASQLNDITDVIDYLLDNISDNSGGQGSQTDPIDPDAGKAVAEKLTID